MDKMLQKQAEIGNRVAFLRKRKGWTQTELAEKSGISTKSYISEIESGTHNLTLKKIVQLEQAFHAKIVMILPASE
jgi:transcriptional regulator with XRE-family HTH domain